MLNILPFEINKIYETKFQTKEKFLVKNIIYNKKGEIARFEGIYENNPALGLCPLNADRLVPEIEKKKLPDLIQNLANAIEQKGLKIQFGLEQQGHIATIEKMLEEFGSATSEHIWEKIGKAIGWDGKTAAFYYIEYLRKNK